MNDNMSRLQAVLLNPAPARKLPARTLVLAALLIVLLAVAGLARAEPSDEEKREAFRKCQAELGPLGVPVWTAEGKAICQHIKTASR